MLDAVVVPEGSAGQLDTSLHNAGDTPDRLVSITCACAKVVQIHDVGDGGRPGPVVSSVKLPPQQIVFFGPNGMQILLTGLTAPLSRGGTVDLLFSFEVAPDASIVAKVRPS